MNTIEYNTVLKASGKTYKQIVFWNRFIKNPIELILSWVPALITLVLLYFNYFNSFLAVIYAVCWIYPIYIFTFQFNNGVKYHLTHRDPSEDAPCIMTISKDGIHASIPEHELDYTFNWDSFTDVYLKYGYYMLFEKKKMQVMLCINDMPKEAQKTIGNDIKKLVDRNKCSIHY